jgi:hypothetical protein
MTLDAQVQIGVLLGMAAGLGVLVLLLGAALEWMLGPVEPEAAPPVDDWPVYLPPVVTHRCVWCREARADADLLAIAGIGLVCREGCDDGRAA